MHFLLAFEKKIISLHCDSGIRISGLPGAELKSGIVISMAWPSSQLAGSENSHADMLRSLLKNFNQHDT